MTVIVKLKEETAEAEGFDLMGGSSRAFYKGAAGAANIQINGNDGTLIIEVKNLDKELMGAPTALMELQMLGLIENVSFSGPVMLHGGFRQDVLRHKSAVILLQDDMTVDDHGYKITSCKIKADSLVDLLEALSHLLFGHDYTNPKQLISESKEQTSADTEMSDHKST